MAKQELKEFDPKQDIGKVVEEVWCKTFFTGFEGDEDDPGCYVESMDPSDLGMEIKRYAPETATHYLLANEAAVFFYPEPDERSYEREALGVTYLRLRERKSKLKLNKN